MKSAYPDFRRSLIRPGHGPNLRPPVAWRSRDPVTERLQAAASCLGYHRVESNDSMLELFRDARLPDQGYAFQVGPRRIRLAASSESGHYYGLLALQAVAAAHPDGLLQGEFEDYPALPRRGFMLDISRCKVPTMATLRELIDRLSLLRYNELQLYTEHTFAYRDHAIVWRDASPITAEEIRELDQYCHDRYIELAPNQNSFGHMERWLRHEPYKRLAESPSGFHHPLSGWKDHGSTLRPGAETADFVGALYGELLPNFRSDRLNIGGDEPWELGQGCSKPLVAQRGKHRVYLDQLLALRERARSYGRSIQFWGDIIIERPDLAAELPDDMVPLLWGYEANHPFAEQCAVMQAAGARYYVVPGTSTWNSLGGRLDNALANIQSAVENAIEYGASGLLLTEWGDNGHHQSDLLKMPLLAYAAGMAWNPEPYEDSPRSALNPLATSLCCDSATLEAVLQLGSLAVAFARPLHNAAWLNKALFTPPERFAPVAEAVSLTELKAARSLLEGVRAGGELGLARDLLDFAARKTAALLHGRQSPRLPMPLLDAFEHHWLKRNRPGGLAESREHLLQANA